MTGYKRGKLPQIGTGRGRSHFHVTVILGAGDPFQYQPGVPQCVSDERFEYLEHADTHADTIKASYREQGYQYSTMRDGTIARLVKSDGRYISHSYNLSVRHCTIRHKETRTS